MPNMSDIEPSLAALRLVQKIVKTGKLTTAAAQLHISQSAASHALKILETQVGTALFVRERWGLRLSEAGQRLLPHIEGVFAHLAEIRAEVARLAKLDT